MPSFPHRCKSCKTVAYTTSALTNPGVCLTCGSVEFTRLANICYLVKTPTEPVTIPDLGLFLPEKFPVIYRSKPHSELSPDAYTQNISTACGAKKFPIHASDQIGAVTCETCRKMSPAFVPEPEQENILEQAQPLPQEQLEPENVEIIETFENEDPNPFISKGE